jgi:predicted ArsR family transcriptional regulator
MAKNLILNAEQLRVMASPACNEVIATLHGMRRASATEIARTLLKSPATILYHLRKLEEVGLATIFEVRPTQRRPEAIYSPTSERLTLPKSDPEGLITRAVLAGMRDAMRGFAATKSRDYKHVLRTQVKLSPENAMKFLAMLDAADQFASESQSEGGEIHLHWNSITYPE